MLKMAYLKVTSSHCEHCPSLPLLLIQPSQNSSSLIDGRCKDDNLSCHEFTSYMNGWQSKSLTLLKVDAHKIELQDVTKVRSKVLLRREKVGKRVKGYIFIFCNKITRESHMYFHFSKYVTCT